MRLNRFLIALMVCCMGGFGSLCDRAFAEAPPLIGIRLNNGSKFANGKTIPLEIKSLKIPENVVAEMQFGFQPDLSDAEWKPYSSGKINITLSGPDGLKTVYARLKDKSGAVSPIESARIMLDTQPPSNCAISIDNGAAFSNDRQMRATLTLSADDAHKMQISANETFTGAIWEDYAERKRWALAPPGDGVKTVYARFMDAAQNISETVKDDIILDTSPPANGSVAINDGAKYTNSTLVMLAISAEGAEKVALMDKSGKSEIFPFEPTNGNIMVKDWQFDSLQGIKVVRAWFMDKAQNKTVNPAQDEIIFDSEGPPAPVIVIDDGKKYTNHPEGKVSIKLISRAGVGRMAISNAADFKDAEPRAFSTSVDNWRLSAAEDGLKRVYVKLFDEAGNPSSPARAEIILDRKKPEIKKILLNEGQKWAVKDKIPLKLNVEGADQLQAAFSESALTTAPWVPFQSEVSEFQLPVGDGKKTLYIRFKDEAGNISETATASVVLDTQPPMGTIEINGGRRFTNDPEKKANIRISAGDAVQMQLSADAGFSGAEWAPVKTEINGWTLAGDDGPKQIFLRLKDEAGNVGDPIAAGITLDRTPPERPGVAINNGAGWINNPARRVTLTLAARGAHEALISSTPAFTGAKWTPLRPTVGWTLSEGDGLKKVFVKYRDEAGNESEVVSSDIILDTQPPVVEEFTLNGGRQFTNQLSVVAKIAARGAHFYALSNEPFENTDEPEWLPVAEKTEWTLPDEDGVKTVFLMLKDSANNLSKPATANVVLDREAPAGGRILIDNNAKYTNHPEKKVSLLIAINHAAEMMISNEKSFKNSEWEPVAVRKHDWILPGRDGEKRVYVKFKDAAGNVSEATSDQIFLDRQPPESPLVTINNDSTYCTRKDRTVALQLAALDAHTMMISQSRDFAGAKWEPYQGEKEYALDGDDGEKEVFVKFKDEAGNESDPVSDQIILDLTPPEIQTIVIHGEEPGSEGGKNVQLTIEATGAEMMMIGENEEFTAGRWVPYQEQVTLELPEEGEKKIFIKVKDKAGNVSGAAVEKSN